LLLYYAAVRDPEALVLSKAKKLVKNATKHPWAKSWPGPLGLFVLGDVSAEEVRKSALFVNEDVTRRQTAQVDFYVGVKALEAGNVASFKRQMKHCANVPKWHLKNEYYLARFEASNSAKQSL